MSDSALSQLVPSGSVVECRRRGWSRRRSGSRRAPAARPAADCWFPRIRAMSSPRIRWPPLSEGSHAPRPLWPSDHCPLHEDRPRRWLERRDCSWRERKSGPHCRGGDKPAVDVWPATSFGSCTRASAARVPGGALRSLSSISPPGVPRPAERRRARKLCRYGRRSTSGKRRRSHAEDSGCRAGAVRRRLGAKQTRCHKGAVPRPE